MFCIVVRWPKLDACSFPQVVHSEYLWIKFRFIALSSMPLLIPTFTADTLVIFPLIDT